MTYIDLYAELLNRYGNDETVDLVITDIIRFADGDNIPRFRMLEQVRIMTRNYTLNDVCFIIHDSSDRKAFQKLCERYEYNVSYSGKKAPYFVYKDDCWIPTEEGPGVSLELHQMEALFNKLNSEI